VALYGHRSDETRSIHTNDIAVDRSFVSSTISACTVLLHKEFGEGGDNMRFHTYNPHNIILVAVHPWSLDTVCPKDLKKGNHVLGCCVLRFAWFSPSVGDTVSSEVLWCKSNTLNVPKNAVLRVGSHLCHRIYTLLALEAHIGKRLQGVSMDRHYVNAIATCNELIAQWRKDTPENRPFNFDLIWKLQRKAHFFLYLESAEVAFPFWVGCGLRISEHADAYRRCVIQIMRERVANEVYERDQSKNLMNARAGVHLTSELIHSNIVPLGAFYDRETRLNGEFFISKRDRKAILGNLLLDSAISKLQSNESLFEDSSSNNRCNYKPISVDMWKQCQNFKFSNSDPFLKTIETKLSKYANGGSLFVVPLESTGVSD
jgi:hypothetical protein